MSVSRWIVTSWGAALRSALEYRASFVVQAGFMLANNFTFLAFWVLFFGRVQQVGGWTLPDVALCYGMSASAFGLTAIFLGGAFELAGAVSRGGLDTWLLRPRSVLLQGLISRTRFSGFGDLATGPLLLVLAGRTTPQRWLLFVAGTLVGSLAFTAFIVACHAAAFWIGRAEELSLLAINAILSFALYPPTLFGGPARLLLFTVVPAGLMSWLPAQLVMSWDAGTALRLIAGVVAACAAALALWSAGLRRYESGNLTQSVDV